MFFEDIFGLIIAFLNVTTFLLLVYLFLLVLGESRSRVLGVLDRVFTPLLKPLRRILPEWRIDISPVIMAVLLQIIVIMVRGR